MYLEKDKLKQTIFIIALFVLGGFLFWLLHGFLSAFLGSVVFYILLRQPYLYFERRAQGRWNKHLVVPIIMLISFLVLVLPLLLVSLMLSGKVSYLIDHYKDILHIAQNFSNQAKQYVGVDLISPESVSKLTSYATEVVPHFISATADALVNIFVMYFLLYYMLVNAHQLESFVRKQMPFKTENSKRLLQELKMQTISNSLGIAVIAVVQGFASAIGYAIFGLDEPFFWGVLTGIASAIPVVGTALVWVPVCMVMYAQGKNWQALALAAYCGVVLSVSEHYFRFLVLKKTGDIHPLIVFFGVVLGIELFGFVGIIFGPLLISYFILLLGIYKNEYIDSY